MMKKSVVSILLVMALLFTTTLVGFAGNRGDFSQQIKQTYTRQLSGPASLDRDENIAARKIGTGLNLFAGSDTKIESIGKPVVCRTIITRIDRRGRANFRNEKESMTSSLYSSERFKFTGVRGTAGTLVSRQEFNRSRCV